MGDPRDESTSGDGRFPGETAASAAMTQRPFRREQSCCVARLGASSGCEMAQPSEPVQLARPSFVGRDEVKGGDLFFGEGHGAGEPKLSDRDLGPEARVRGSRSCGTIRSCSEAVAPNCQRKGGE